MTTHLRVVIAGGLLLAASQAAAQGAEGEVRYVAIRKDDVVLHGVPGYPRGFRGASGMLYTVLFHASCHGTSFQLVEVDRRDDLRREIALSRSRWTDPAYRMRERFSEPAYFVKGEGRVDAHGILTVELRLEEAATGRVVSTVTATGPIEMILGVVDEAGLRLGSELCPEPRPAPLTDLRAETSPEFPTEPEPVSTFCCLRMCGAPDFGCSLIETASCSASDEACFQGPTGPCRPPANTALPLYPGTDCSMYGQCSSPPTCSSP